MYQRCSVSESMTDDIEEPVFPTPGYNREVFIPVFTYWQEYTPPVLV